jgi:formamidopyrimidine-DNA glycosylase
MYGEYTKKSIAKGKLRITNWEPKAKEGPLRDPYNRFIHVVFSLSNGKHFVMCDSRKFGKVTMVETELIHNSIHLKGIGPEPLEKSFTFKIFKERLLSKSGTRNAMKTLLMDQSIIAGIGNIYSDEMLWLAGIHPESVASKVPDKSLKSLYVSMQEVLRKGIDFGGDSMSDYRDVNGERGRFQNHHNAYRKAKETCGKKGCRGVILRKVISGRSAHFCSAHQKLFK